MRRIFSIIPVLLSLSALPLYAISGEADAVVRYCGVPQAQNVGASPVTGLTQRDLIYPNAILHFVPDGAGWTFTTGWRGHFPVTRAGLQASMPCFRQALEEVAAQPAPAIDPTTLQQTIAAVPVSSNTWGFPHLGLIVALGIAFLVVVLWPRRRRSIVREQATALRTRKPQIPSYMDRRTPRLT